MARLPLNQTSLHSQSKRLASFERFLPSVDLKRRQLIAERNKARRSLADRRAELQAVTERVADRFPMLAAAPEDLSTLVTVRHREIAEENLMGVRLPILTELELETKTYTPLACPHWVDRLVEYLEEALELKLRCLVDAERLRLLEVAVRKSTQRFNLFDKVLIPRTKAHIRQIQIFLADQSTAAVVRAKIAKTRTRGGAT